MKKLAILHTVPSVYADFPKRVREAVGDVKIVNIVDEFLSTDANERGTFTRNNLNRLYGCLRNAETTDPDAIVVSCSTLTPGVEKLRDCIGVPIVCIDGAMVRKALGTGSRITVIATAPSAARATRETLDIQAAKQGGGFDMRFVVLEDAFNAILRLDTATHDRLVLAAAADIRDRDVAMLAQASTAHLAGAIEKATGIPTLAAPELCLEEIRQVLGVK